MHLTIASHHRLLNVMCSSLDTFLLLQTQYNIQEVLLQLQTKSMLPSRYVWRMIAPKIVMNVKCLLMQSL